MRADRPAAAELAGALRQLVDEEPCTLDHDGDCQTHNAGTPCAVAVARSLLVRFDAANEADRYPEHPDGPSPYGIFDEAMYWQDPTAPNHAAWRGRTP